MAGTVGLEQRHEALLHAEESGVDRGPLRLPGAVVEVDLANPSDLVARAVQQFGANQVSNIGVVITRAPPGSLRVAPVTHEDHPMAPV
jgi:hypothetical protein